MAETECFGFFWVGGTKNKGPLLCQHNSQNVTKMCAFEISDNQILNPTIH